MSKILIVDDDTQGLDSTRRMLEMDGHTVLVASNGKEALDIVRMESSSNLDVILSDVRMPELDGLHFVRALHTIGCRVPVVLMTAFGRVEEAVWAMKMGAVDFLTKPFKRQALVAAIDQALKRSVAVKLAAQRASGAPAVGAAVTDHLIGESAAMRKLRQLIEQVAQTQVTVLVHGESGTGKEVVSRRIHAMSARAQSPFVAINCASVPENLIESELFGYEKGAFTGAQAARIGLFESADSGTLLLDEIGDMPLALQPTLLRVLQEGEIRRLGALVSRKVDVRVIAATHRDLAQLQAAGRFRQDLRYRLEVVHLQTPTLRERMEDLPLLIRHFLGTANSRHGKSVTEFSPEALSVLLSHSWPGNVRELANVIERAVIFSEGDRVERSTLPPTLKGVSGGAPMEVSGTFEIKLGTPLKEVEDLLIRKTLEAADGDKNVAAKVLGINPRTIYRKLDQGP